MKKGLPASWALLGLASEIPDLSLSIRLEFRGEI